MHTLFICHRTELKWHPNHFFSSSNAHEGNVEVNSNIDHQEKSKKNGDFQDEDAIPKPEFKRSHFLRRWLSQSTSWIPKKKALA